MINCCILRYNSNKQTQKNNVMNTQNTQNQSVTLEDLKRQERIEVLKNEIKTLELVSQVQSYSKKYH